MLRKIYIPFRDDNISSILVLSEINRASGIANQRRCEAAAIWLSGQHVAPRIVARDFLGNSWILGPRGDRLGVWNPPRACTRYPLPVVSATLVVGTPRGILNGESIKYPLCQERENDIASVTGVCSVSWYAGVICICLYRIFFASFNYTILIINENI